MIFLARAYSPNEVVASAYNFINGYDVDNDTSRP